jgi:HPt (histidine-containing phosphotransfer) domain-containing protein
MADDVIYVDVTEGFKRVLNNAKVFIKLLADFKKDPSFNELISAMDVQDMERAQAAVHAIKGLSGNLSLKELFKHSFALESRIKSNLETTDQLTAFKNVYFQTLTEIDKVVAQYG